MKVIDRRRFTEDGEGREGVADTDPAVTAESVETSSVAKNAQSRLEGSDVAEGGLGRNARGVAAGAAHASGSSSTGVAAAAAHAREMLRPLDFATFIESLATVALLHLGILKPADTKDEDVKVDLVLAKEQIDLLGILEEKTKGNLTREEATLLAAILQDLRFAYVSRVESVKKA